SLRYLGEQKLRHPAQGFEHADAVRRLRFEPGEIESVELAVQVLDRQGGREVALVELDDEGNRPDIDSIRFEVHFEVGKALAILRHLVGGGIRDEYDRIDPLEHQLSGRVVVHLTGDRIKEETGLHPLEIPQVQRQEIEEERAVG